MTAAEYIAQLRREANELDSKKCSFSAYANNAYKAKIRRSVADKLEKQLRSGGANECK